MLKLSPKLTAIIAATATAGFSGAAIAGAADSPSKSSTSTTRQHRSNETPLTGDTKTKVEAAALAKVPGTVVRTETDEGGVYESHVRKSDGTEVVVKVNKDFEVTAVETVAPGGRGGHGGHGGHGGPGGVHGDLAAIAKSLDATEAELRSAVDAARPDRSANGKDDRGAESAAAIAKSLGESTADVQAVLDAAHESGDGHRGRGHGHGDDTALVAALVKKFSVTEAKAQAAVDAAEKAHEAERSEKQAALYAAVAKTLGKDADAVQKAFEANR